MPDQRKARRVSGEIMTAPAPGLAGGASRPAGEVLDADFEELTRPVDKERAQPAARSFQPGGDGPAPEGMAMLRKDAAPPPHRPAGRGGPIFWGAGLGLALAAFWASGGHALVRGLPLFAQHDAATALTISALTISGVTSRVDGSGPRAVLMVDGEAGNDGAATTPLPPLDIAVTDNAGRITRYRLGTSGRALAPGERFAFSSRLEVPRNGVTAVSVGFAE